MTKFITGTQFFSHVTDHLQYGLHESCNSLYQTRLSTRCMVHYSPETVALGSSWDTLLSSMNSFCLKLTNTSTAMQFSHSVSSMYDTSYLELFMHHRQGKTHAALLSHSQIFSYDDICLLLFTCHHFYCRFAMKCKLHKQSDYHKTNYCILLAHTIQVM